MYNFFVRNLHRTAQVLKKATKLAQPVQGLGGARRDAAAVRVQGSEGGGYGRARWPRQGGPDHERRSTHLYGGQIHVHQSGSARLRVKRLAKRTNAHRSLPNSPTTVDRPGSQLRNRQHQGVVKCAEADPSRPYCQTRRRSGTGLQPRVGSRERRGSRRARRGARPWPRPGPGRARGPRRGRRRGERRGSRTGGRRRRSCAGRAGDPKGRRVAPRSRR